MLLHPTQSKIITCKKLFWSIISDIDFVNLLSHYDNDTAHSLLHQHLQYTYPQSQILSIHDTIVFYANKLLQKYTPHFSSPHNFLGSPTNHFNFFLFIVSLGKKIYHLVLCNPVYSHVPRSFHCVYGSPLSILQSFL